ncbi:MAG: alternative ribosome rescue aminoacyl-tRNA hydrolase ArfB [Planctomycetota bacterium]|nr:alternative ribosome rescue aminoacyl-tRNA hydrolase ArfB [Planctomycetota bacterium]
MSLEDLRVDSRVVIAGSELEVRTSRSSGPGGQHVNKTETAVELRLDVRPSECLSNNDKERILEALAPRLAGAASTLIVRASSHRSQRRNLDEARERMAELLARALAPRKARRATKPTRGSQRRRLDAKRRRSDIKRQRRKRGED